MSSRFNSMSEELFQILKGSGKVLTLFDAQGRKVYEPATARKFFAEPDKMMISVNEADSDSSINLYLSQNADLKVIAGLINTLRAMSSRYNVILDVKKYGKELSPKDFAYQTIGEASMWGSTKTSYQRIGQSKLIVRHCAPIREDIMGSRARNILSLFVETKQGERLKFPVSHLSGARAWAYHLSEGGSAHDAMGSYIVELSQEASDLTKVSRYIHYARNILAEEASGVRAQLRYRVAEVRKELQALGRPRGYQRALESKVYENRTTIRENRQQAIELECQRLRELLDIDSNHALAETILPVALITLGENMTTDTTKFGQILALESVDELIECFASEYGFEEGTHWARHELGLALLPEAATAAEDYLSLIDESFEIYENGADAYETFAAQWFAGRKAVSGQEGESPDDRDEKKSQQKVADLAQGLRDINSGKQIANVRLPADMPRFADRSAEVRFKLGLYLEASAAMQNDALWTFISTIIDKLQDGQKLTQVEAIFAGKLVAALDHVAEGVGEQDDILEYGDPTSYEAGRAADRAEDAEAEIHHEFEKYLMGEFLQKYYPYFYEPCDQGDEPMSMHDVKGDLNGFLDKELNDRLESDGYEVHMDTVNAAMAHVEKLAKSNGWTFDEPIEPVKEAAVDALSIGDRVATDYGPAEVLEVGRTKVKVMLAHGQSKVLPIGEVEYVNDVPSVPVKELAEMEAWFEQFDPQTILTNEAEVQGDGFMNIVCNAFKDGESVATIAQWSLVAPDEIEKMLTKAGLMGGEQMAAEGEIEEAREPMYHSVFFQMDDGTWGHQFDADDAIDAKAEADGLKRDGYKVKILKVAKSAANWGNGPGQVNPNDFVKNALAAKAMKEDAVAEEEVVTEYAASPEFFDGAMIDPRMFVKKAGQHYGVEMRATADALVNGDYYHDFAVPDLKHLAQLASDTGETELASGIKAYLQKAEVQEAMKGLKEAVGTTDIDMSAVMSEMEEFAKKVLANPAEYGVEQPVGYDDMDEQDMNFKNQLVGVLVEELKRLLGEVEFDYDVDYKKVGETSDMGDDFIEDVKKDDEEDTDNAFVGDLAHLRRLAGMK